jgi:hypothetical protein
MTRPAPGGRPPKEGDDVDAEPEVPAAARAAGGLAQVALGSGAGAVVIGVGMGMIGGLQLPDFLFPVVMLAGVGTAALVMERVGAVQRRQLQAARAKPPASLAASATGSSAAVPALRDEEPR